MINILMHQTSANRNGNLELKKLIFTYQQNKDCPACIFRISCFNICLILNSHNLHYIFLQERDTICFCETNENKLSNHFQLRLLAIKFLVFIQSYVNFIPRMSIMKVFHLTLCDISNLTQMYCICV